MDPAGPFALSIDAWDRVTTGLGCPGVPLPPDQNQLLDEGIITYYGDGRIIRYERGHYVNALDRTSSEIFTWRADGKDLALYERAKPFPNELEVWYRDQGVQQLHAGLVAREGKGVLFIGQSGSGKSTCTLACALDGFDYLGDDHNGLQMTQDGRCIGHSFYNAARIGPGHLKHFPKLVEHEVPPHNAYDHKSLVYMTQVTGRVTSKCEIVAVIMPRIVPGGTTRFRRASQGSGAHRSGPQHAEGADGRGARRLHEPDRFHPQDALLPDGVWPRRHPDSRLRPADHRPGRGGHELMRILYWTESFWPRIGGSEVAAQVLIDALRRRGHQFEVVTRQWSPDQPATDDWHGVPVHRVAFDDDTFEDAKGVRNLLPERPEGCFAQKVPDPFSVLLPLRQRVAAIKRKLRADVVQVGLTGPSLFLHNFTAGQFPAPMVITLHVMPVETEFGVNKPVRQAFRAATHIVAVSQAVARQIRQRLPELAAPCTIIHNALPEPQTPRAPVSFVPPRLLCVGACDRTEGVRYRGVGQCPGCLKSFPTRSL